MGHNSIRYLETASAGQSQPKGQVHVLGVAEEALIETADASEPVRSIEGSGGARSERLARWRHWRTGSPMTATPGGAGTEIGIARAVEKLGIIRTDLQGAEHYCARAVFRGANERG